MILNRDRVIKRKLAFRYWAEALGMAITIADVAKAAGVSRSTVSKALGSIGYVSPETKAKVIEIAAALDYRPSYFARSLSKGTSSMIGVVTTPSILSVFGSAVHPIENAIRDAGYSLLLYITSGDPESERLCLEETIDKNVAGVIAIPSAHPADIKYYRDLVDRGIKLVVIDRCVEGLETPQVGGDDYQSARIAAEYLISLGHRKIVYLAIPRVSYAGREREQGFRDAMSDAGIALTGSSIIDTDFGEEYGEAAINQLLKSGDMPTAVIARHDLVAIGAMRAVFAAGLSVPGDVSIIGNADISLNDMIKVPLTTVRHPVKEMSAIGVAKLLDMLAGKHVDPVITKLPVELIVRSSCAPPTRLRVDG
ncbi:MAG: LacI family DNA-binding transcriptional regulator [Armatimonadota bacterium]